MKIRLLTAGDRAQLALLARQYAEEPRPVALGVKVDRVEAFLDFALEHYTIFGAFLPGVAAFDCGCVPQPDRLVGFVALHAFAHPWTAELLVEEVTLYVSATQRGGPAFSQLVAASENWATTNRAVRFKMSAPSGSPVGDYLERLGFTALETSYLKTL